jgi:hypothetical protein
MIEQATNPAWSDWITRGMLTVAIGLGIGGARGAQLRARDKRRLSEEDVHRIADAIEARWDNRELKKLQDDDRMDRWRRGLRE